MFGEFLTFMSKQSMHIVIDKTDYDAAEKGTDTLALWEKMKAPHSTKFNSGNAIARDQ